jgi:hypothetical protein
MHVVVLLIVLAVIAFLLYKSVQDARERAAGGGTDEPRMPRPEPRRPSPRPRSRPRGRQRKPQIDEEALAEHVAKLREAVRTDLISLDEAVASVIRQTEGALSEEAARKLLQENASG